MIIPDDGCDGEEEIAVVDVDEAVDLLFCLGSDVVIGALESGDNDLFDTIHICNYDCSAFPVIPRLIYYPQRGIP